MRCRWAPISMAISSRTCPITWRAHIPGLIVAGLATMAAGFVSDHYGAPLTLMSLLIGLALNFLGADKRMAPGARLRLAHAAALGDRAGRRADHARADLGAGAADAARGGGDPARDAGERHPRRALGRASTPRSARWRADRSRSAARRRRSRWRRRWARSASARRSSRWCWSASRRRARPRCSFIRCSRTPCTSATTRPASCSAPRCTTSRRRWVRAIPSRNAPARSPRSSS